MYNSDTELLFPERVIPELIALRGEAWQQLVQTVLDEKHPSYKAGFVLMMVHQSGCISCSTHSYRATRGCTMCAQQTVRRFRGSDADFIKQFEQSRQDIIKYLSQCTESQKHIGFVDALTEHENGHSIG